MGLSIQELKARALEPALNEREFALTSAGGATVILRRIPMGVRNRILAKHKLKAGDDLGQSLAMAQELIAASFTEATPEALDDMPSAVVDELVAIITEFNGWTKEAQAVATAQF